jgi:hypothetical protein
MFEIATIQKQKAPVWGVFHYHLGSPFWFNISHNNGLISFDE